MKMVLIATIVGGQSNLRCLPLKAHTPSESLRELSVVRRVLGDKISQPSSIFAGAPQRPRRRLRPPPPLSAEVVKC